jgi:hypothetical protein
LDEIIDRLFPDVEPNVFLVAPGFAIIIIICFAAVGFTGALEYILKKIIP